MQLDKHILNKFLAPFSDKELEAELISRRKKKPTAPVLQTEDEKTQLYCRDIMLKKLYPPRYR